MAACCANATDAFFKLPQLPRPVNSAHNNTMGIILPIVLAALALTGLACAWRPTRGTTLRAAWWWSVAAVVAGVHAEPMPRCDRRFGGGGQCTGFAAAIWTFCPASAVFGAKRPQDRAWQWIVLAFWGILSLPAAEAVVFNPHEPPHPHPVWSWFLMGLIVVGRANYLFTRYWVSGLAVAAAHACCLAPRLLTVFAGPTARPDARRRFGNVDGRDLIAGRRAAAASQAMQFFGPSVARFPRSIRRGVGPAHRRTAERFGPPEQLAAATGVGRLSERGCCGCGRVS